MKSKDHIKHYILFTSRKDEWIVYLLSMRLNNNCANNSNNWKVKKKYENQTKPSEWAFWVHCFVFSNESNVFLFEIWIQIEEKFEQKIQFEKTFMFQSTCMECQRLNEILIMHTVVFSLSFYIHVCRFTTRGQQMEVHLKCTKRALWFICRCLQTNFYIYFSSFGSTICSQCSA